MNSVFSVTAKVDSIIQCMKTIVNSLQTEKGKISSFGTDDILPVLIFVVLRAKPRQMYSNLNYMNLFMSENARLS